MEETTQISISLQRIILCLIPNKIYFIINADYNIKHAK